MAKLKDIVKKAAHFAVPALLYFLSPSLNKSQAVEFKNTDVDFETKEGFIRTKYGYDIKISDSIDSLKAKNKNSEKMLAVLDALYQDLGAIDTANKSFKEFQSAVTQGGKFYNIVADNSGVILNINKEKGEVSLTYKKGKKNITEKISNLGFTNYNPNLSPSSEDLESLLPGTTYQAREEKEKAELDAKADERIKQAQTELAKLQPQQPVYSQPTEEQARKAEHSKTIDNIVEQAEQQKQLEAKQEIKQEKQKQKYISVSESREKILLENFNYFMTGNNGFVLEPKYHDLESLVSISSGTTLESIKANSHSSIRYINLHDNKIIADSYNFRTQVAVLLNTDNNEKVLSTKLLFKPELEKLLFEDSRDKRLNGKNVNEVLNNYSQLRDKNISVIRDMKQEYDNGIIFVGIPAGKSKDNDNIHGVAYVVYNSTISKIIDLNSYQFDRAAEPRLRLSVANSGDLIDVNALYANLGIIDRTRWRFNTLSTKEKKEMQYILSSTSKTGRNNIFGFGAFSKDTGTEGYNEYDVFYRYLKDNLMLSALSGVSEDGIDFGASAYGTNQTLTQNRRGSTDFPSIMLAGKIGTEGQTPLIWGSASADAGVRYVQGANKDNWQILDANGNVTSFGDSKTGIKYSGALANIHNNWEITRFLNAGISVGAGVDKYSQQENQSFVDYINSQTRLGGNIRFKRGNLDASAMLVSQNNLNSGNSLVSNAQLMYSHKNKAVLLNTFGDNFRDDYELTASFLLSPYGKEFLRREAEIKRKEAVYKASNNNQLVPIGLNSNQVDIPHSIPKGLELTVSNGKQFGLDLCKAALRYYVGSLGAGLEYSKQGSNETRKVSVDYAFR